MTSGWRKISAAVSRACKTRPHFSDVLGDAERGDEDDLHPGDPGYDYSAGGVCGECDSALTRDGYCRNRQCVYAGYYQDEIVPVNVRAEKRQVAANMKSRRYYTWGSRGFKRTTASPHGVVFRSAEEAERAGYEEGRG